MSSPPVPSSPLQHLEAEYSLSDGRSDPTTSLELGHGLSPVRADKLSDMPVEYTRSNISETGGYGDSTLDSGDCDDAEDVINMTSKTLPAHSSQDLIRILSGEYQSTPEELHLFKKRRAELEAEVKDECIQHEQEALEEAAFPGGRFGLGGFLQHGHAPPVAPEFEAVGAEQVDQILRERTADANETFESIGVGDLSVLDSRPTTPVSERISIASSSPPLATTSPQHFAEKASLATSSPPIIQTPGRKHIEFVQNSSVQDTPFTKTLNHFKQYKGKDISPNKSRRNASLPEEIAELAKEIQEDEEDEAREELEKYRDLDITPLDQVMEDGIAGDLILPMSPPKQSSVQKLVDTEVNQKGSTAPKILKLSSKEDLLKIGGIAYELDILGHHGEVITIFTRATASVQQVKDSIRQQALELGAEEVQINETIEEFLTHPEKFMVPNDNTKLSPKTSYQAISPDAGQMQLIVYPEPAAFINVISMIPAALFYVTAAPAVHYANRVYEMMLEKLAGLAR